jgi:hypothetical protein
MRAGCFCSAMLSKVPHKEICRIRVLPSERDLVEFQHTFKSLKVQSLALSRQLQFPTHSKLSKDVDIRFTKCLSRETNAYPPLNRPRLTFLEDLRWM